MSVLDRLAGRGCVIGRAGQAQMFVDEFSEEEVERVQRFLDGVVDDGEEDEWGRGKLLPWLVNKIQALEERFGQKTMLAISVGAGAVVGLVMSGIFVLFCTMCCLSD